MPKLIRPPDKADVTAFLRMLFLRTERELVNEITRKRTSGYVDYAEVAAIERVQRILQTMVDESWSYVPVMIEKIFYQTEAGAAGYRNARVLTSTEMSVIQQLSNNLLGKLEEAAETVEKNARGFLTVGRLESDPYRRETLLQVSRQQAAGTSWVKGSKELAKDLQNKGITAFTDKAGRNWSLQDYSNMAVRTTARQAQVAAILTKDPNHDLYQIVKIGSTCPVCAPLEGRVYSRSGTNPEYPALTLAYGKMDPAGPDDIMNTYLNIHPNCLHSLIPYTTIGKTEKQIQKDKDFSNPEKNPLNRDPRTKKQIAAYQKKERERRRLLSDKRQYREYRTVLGNEVPKDFDKFLEMKYNETEKWEAKSREYKTILKIKSKDSYSNTYRKKMIDTYYNFKKHGYEFTDHSLNRFLGQKTGKGKRLYSQDELLDILKKPPNYSEAGGRTVNFYNDIAVIQNPETREIVSIVTRENVKKGWVSL